MNKFFTLAFATGIAAISAVPVSAESLRIRIDSETTIIIDEGFGQQKIDHRVAGNKYFYDHALKIGSIWVAWNEGEDPNESGEGQTHCWPAANTDGYLCGWFLDGQRLFPPSS